MCSSRQLVNALDIYTYTCVFSPRSVVQWCHRHFLCILLRVAFFCCLPYLEWCMLRNLWHDLTWHFINLLFLAKNVTMPIYDRFLRKWQEVRELGGMWLVSSSPPIPFLHTDGRQRRWKNPTGSKRCQPCKRWTGKMPIALCAWNTHITLCSSSVHPMIRAAVLTCVELATATRIAWISSRKPTPRGHCLRKFLQIALALIWTQRHWLQKKLSPLTLHVHCAVARWKGGQW